VATTAPTPVPTPAVEPTRLVDAAPVPELPATGTGGLALGLALIGSGVVVTGGAGLIRRYVR